MEKDMPPVQYREITVRVGALVALSSNRLERSDGVVFQWHSVICDPWTMKLVPDPSHISGQRLVTDHRGACAGCPRQGRMGNPWNILIPVGTRHDHLRVRWILPELPEGQGRILSSGEEVCFNMLFHDPETAAHFLAVLEEKPRPFPHPNAHGGFRW